MNNKNMVVCAAGVSLLCLLWTASATSSELDSSKLRDIQQARENAMRALEQSGENFTNEPRQTLNTTAKFLLVDTDDDGMADNWETANGLNPTDPNDAWLDPDKDQVVNLFEYQLGSKLNDASTPAVITVAAAGARFTSVAEAIAQAPPGTVIRVAGGTYPVNYETTEPKVVMILGGWNANFTARNFKLYPTTFDGGFASEIFDFTITGSGNPVIVLDGINFIKGKGRFAGAINLWALGNTIMRTSISNCSINGNEADGSSGALEMHNDGMSESDLTIANSVISGNGGSGIVAINGNEGHARWRIINSTISNNKNAGSNGYGVYISTSNNAVLNARISNSIIWGNDQVSFKLLGTPNMQKAIKFNVNYSNLDSEETSLGAIINRGAGILNVDPLFIDPTAANYHLQANSPMIDAGTNRGIPATDFEGELRLSGAAVDIGADEVIVPAQ